METTKEVEKATGVLNDLIRINNDRVAGYEKAANEIKDSFDAEIKSVFFQMAEESRGYSSSLADAVIRLGGKPVDDDTTASGKIYRAWMDVKATFSGDDVLAALRSCEFGEDAAQKAYKEAVEEKIDWPAGILNLIQTQRDSLRLSHDKIKRYRDEYAETTKTH